MRLVGPYVLRAGGLLCEGGRRGRRGRGRGRLITRARRRVAFVVCDVKQRCWMDGCGVRRSKREKTVKTGREGVGRARTCTCGLGAEGGANETDRTEDSLRPYTVRLGLLTKAADCSR